MSTKRAGRSSGPGPRLGWLEAMRTVPLQLGTARQNGLVRGLTNNLMAFEALRLARAVESIVGVLFHRVQTPGVLGRAVVFGTGAGRPRDPAREVGVPSRTSRVRSELPCAGAWEALSTWPSPQTRLIAFAIAGRFICESREGRLDCGR